MSDISTVTDAAQNDYRFREIEPKWHAAWDSAKAYQVSNSSSKPKYYVLDMFPYPSGAGLHVGHPLGYIASDIYSRYKRLKGFNVLHPMGFDSFGLPAEQYALDTGRHPADTTKTNIATFKKQLDNIGFSYDWSREIRTSDASYYKWTQWIFLELFDSFFNRNTSKAEKIESLVAAFEKEGNISHVSPGDGSLQFTADQWENFDHGRKEDILMDYRLSFCGYGEVNWCEALGTVLANDEVVNGVSERGGFPVVKKKLRQWYLRITEYADRLLQGLSTVEFSDAMKEMQTNWIGKSSGAEIVFALDGHSDIPDGLRVYTTRPDTIFGVDFMVIAPEHELVDLIKTDGQRTAVDEYTSYVKSRSERERMAEKKITGVFTGAYAVNPFDGKKIPVWISEYVLAGYGTGAIMAVPCGDERDLRFAKHFDIPVTNIIGKYFNGEEANPTKDAILEHSGFLTGLLMKDAIDLAINAIEEKGIGVRRKNYKMRDAAFSRQRYWGEPFPVQWIEGVAVPLQRNELPLELPKVDSYKPGPDGEGPLANIPEWTSRKLETNTMPGYAGSSWYFLRYMDPHNDGEFCARNISDYWNQVDVYIGGTEHAVGHLLYSRMWTKILFDLGYIGFDEPFRKLVNQGMIQGSSRFVYRVKGSNTFVSAGLKDGYETDSIHADVNFVDGVEMDVEAFKQWKPEFAAAEFILEDGKYICGVEVEKMSKSKFNTVNPDDLVAKYGADTFRMYEMFLGPVEMSKPWDTKGIEGVHRFLKKLWRLFYDELKGQVWTSEKATAAELKVLHQTIRRIENDTERFSFNTAVSGFMIAVNELSDLNCHKKEVLEQLLVLLVPYAPHITEELWHRLGNAGSVLDAAYPVFDASLVTESSKEYPVSVNGKLRTTMVVSLDAVEAQVHELVLGNEIVQKWLEGKAPKKIVFVKGKMINVVI
ncbi:MAG: leucine--tRNA ligase [Chitinophagaceae bacterium]|nr:MAG: leucine--tRNA ligase [Chitinophagaceae bacterium]